MHVGSECFPLSLSLAAAVIAAAVAAANLLLLLLQVFSGATAAKLHGQVGVTETGVPLWSPQPDPGIQSPEDLEKAFTGYCFNTALSDSLSLDREIPSFDSAACAKRREAFSKAYPFEAAEAAAAAAAAVPPAAAAAAAAADIEAEGKGGEQLQDPRASVVIVFHNESLSVLLRSIHSVLNRTPPLLLKEIILVNDDSDPQTHPWLFNQLETYVAVGLPKTKLLTLKQRRGLMGARAAGAAVARGSVLVFLDSHIEVLPFWLEPLLQRIRESPKTAALPRVASIEAETFEIVNGGIDTLAFNWSLGHMHRDDEIKAREENRNKEEGEPIESPIMPGGIFAISREWWNTLGGYDEGLRLYAGEEFELSFKYVLLTTPPVEDEFLGDLTKQQELRKRLNCRSFQWYLDNVYPELEAPSLETAKTGAIARRDLNACVDTMQKDSGTLGAFPCHFSHGTQAFLFDGSTGRLFVGQKGFNACVGGDPSSLSVIQFKCAREPPAGVLTRWEYSEDTKQLQLVPDDAAAAAAAAAAAGEGEGDEETAAADEPDDHAAAAAAAAAAAKQKLCLYLYSFPTESSPFAVELTPCDSQDPGQQLEFVP
ncbi:hypothetical protein Emed_005543 [Eimeria media]